MANRFWVMVAGSGTGTWDAATTTHWSATSGGAGGASVPTAADDVFFDANSGVGTVTPSAATTVAKSIDFTAYTGTFACASGVAVTIGNASGGALTISAGMTLSNTGAGNFTFVSTSSNGGAGWLITTAGKTLPAVVFSGAGGKWVLADALTTSAGAAITLTAGTWDTASFAVNCGIFSSTNSNTRTLTLGSSSITITTTGASWNTTVITGLTITANTATITMNGTAPNFRTGSINYNGTSVVLDGTNAGSTAFGSDTAGSPTFANLTYIGPAAKTGAAISVWSPTITGTLTFRSNNSTNRMFVSSNAVGTQKSFSCAGATVVIDNTAAAAGSSVDFQDLTITGSPTWTVNNSTLVGDCGGNGGAITANATAPSTQTHTASAGGNWSDVTKWTSRVPLPQDNVVVNVNTTGTLTADMPRLGASIDFTGFAGTFVCSVTGSIVTIFGSLTLASGMTWTPQNTFVCQGRGNQTITSHGITTPTFVVQAGTYVPQDALAGADNTRSFSVQAVGVFDNSSNNVSVTYSAVNVLNTSSLIAGAATWTLTATSGTVWNHTAGTMSAASATIVISAVSTSARTFAGLGKSYGTITYTVANSPGQLVITGANTFTSLNIGSGRQLQMPASTTNTFANAPSWSGQNNGYLRLPGVSGSYASSPDSAALSITGDITIDCRAALDAWVGVVAGQILVAKSLAGQSSYQLFIDVNGKPILDLWATVAGANTRATSSAVVPFSAGATGWVRATWRASDGRVQFFTSTDDITYTQLGTNQTIAIASIADSTAILEVGSKVSGTNTLATGNFYQARVWSDITQTTKVFDADFTVHNAGSNNWTTSAKVQFQEASTNAANVNLNGLAQVGDGRVALTSSTGGTQATVNYTGTGVVNSDYLTIQDSNATPGSTWYAGTHSSNVSNNTGWTFTAGDSGTMSLSLALTADSAARAVPTASLSLSVGATAGVSAVATASLSLVTTAAASAPVVPTASLTLAATAAAVAPVVPIGALELALTAAATAPITPTGTLALLLAAAAAAPISPTAALDLLLVATAMATPTVTPAIALLLSAVAAGTAGATMDLELLASASAVAAAAATMMLELDIVAALALAVLVFDLNAVGIRFGYLADPVQAGFEASAPAIGFVAADTAFGRQ